MFTEKRRHMVLEDLPHTESSNLNTARAEFVKTFNHARASKASMFMLAEMVATQSNLIKSWQETEEVIQGAELDKQRRSKLLISAAGYGFDLDERATTANLKAEFVEKRVAHRAEQAKIVAKSEAEAKAELDKVMADRKEGAKLLAEHRAKLAESAESETSTDT